MVGVVRSLVRYNSWHSRRRPPMVPPPRGAGGRAQNVAPPTLLAVGGSAGYVLRFAGAGSRVEGVADGDRACAVVDVAEGIAVGLDGLH